MVAVVDVGTRLMLLMARPISWGTKVLGDEDTPMEVREAVSAEPETYRDLVRNDMTRLIGWLILMLCAFLLVLPRPLIARWGGASVVGVFDVVNEFLLLTFALAGVWSSVKAGIGWGCRDREVAGDNSLRRRLATPSNVDIVGPVVIVVLGFIARSTL